MHDPPVAHDDETGALASLGGDRPAARCVLDTRRAERVGTKRAVLIEVELVDPAVAPDLLGRLEATSGRRAARLPPVGVQPTSRVHPMREPRPP